MSLDLNDKDLDRLKVLTSSLVTITALFVPVLGLTNQLISIYKFNNYLPVWVLSAILCLLLYLIMSLKRKTDSNFVGRYVFTKKVRKRAKIVLFIIPGIVIISILLRNVCFFKQERIIAIAYFNEKNQIFSQNLQALIGSELNTNSYSIVPIKQFVRPEDANSVIQKNCFTSGVMVYGNVLENSYLCQVRIIEGGLFNKRLDSIFRFDDTQKLRIIKHSENIAKYVAALVNLKGGNIDTFDSLIELVLQNSNPRDSILRHTCLKFSAVRHYQKQQYTNAINDLKIARSFAPKDSTINHIIDFIVKEHSPTTEQENDDKGAGLVDFDLVHELIRVTKDKAISDSLVKDLQSKLSVAKLKLSEPENRNSQNTKNDSANIASRIKKEYANQIEEYKIEIKKLKEQVPEERVTQFEDYVEPHEEWVKSYNLKPKQRIVIETSNSVYIRLFTKQNYEDYKKDIKKGKRINQIIIPVEGGVLGEIVPKGTYTLYPNKDGVHYLSVNNKKGSKRIKINWEIRNFGK